MQADKWLEVNLVGLVILGGLMFVTTKVMNLGSSVAEVQNNLAATTERVEKLAQALPTLGARVAEEQMTRPLRSVVLVSMPERLQGKLRVTVSIIDTQGAQRWVGTLAVASAADRAVVSQLAWAGYQLDPQFASFTRMLSYARMASLDATLPAQIDPAVSFVLGTTAPSEVLAAANRLGLTPKPAAFDLKIEDWKDLSAALRTHTASFTNTTPGATPPPTPAQHPNRPGARPARGTAAARASTH